MGGTTCVHMSFVTVIASQLEEVGSPVRRSSFSSSSSSQKVATQNCHKCSRAVLGGHAQFAAPRLRKHRQSHAPCCASVPSSAARRRHNDGDVRAFQPQPRNDSSRSTSQEQERNAPLSEPCPNLSSRLVFLSSPLFLHLRPCRAHTTHPRVESRLPIRVLLTRMSLCLSMPVALRCAPSRKFPASAEMQRPQGSWSASFQVWISGHYVIITHTAALQDGTGWIR